MKRSDATVVLARLPIPERAATQLRRTAYHEAGHAVIARVLDLAHGSATIIPNYEESEAGPVVIFDPRLLVNRWELSGRDRPYGAGLRAYAMMAMAGRLAEIEFLGRCRGGDGDDCRKVNFCLDSLGVPDSDFRRYHRRLERFARQLVRRHRGRIERVAAALVERQTLAGEEIGQLVAIPSPRPRDPEWHAVHLAFRALVRPDEWRERALEPDPSDQPRR
jgi:ATP-dependent Zn protease